MKILLIYLLLTLSNSVLAAPNWEGEWPSANGELELTKCKDDHCEFSLGAVLGANTCDLDGMAKISGAQITLTSTHDPDVKSCVIHGDILDSQITFKDIPAPCKYYCSLNANLDIRYTKKGIAPIYPTSFDCQKTTSEIEKVICHDEILAQGDRELNSLFQDRLSKNAGEKNVQKEWLIGRNTGCNHMDSSCIGDRMQKRIKELKTQFLCDDQTTNSFVLHYTLRKFLGKIVYAEYDDLMKEVETSNIEEGCFAQGSSPGFKTVAEGAITYKDEKIWLAFTHIDEKGASEMVIYGPKGKSLMPKALRDWITNFSARAKKILPEKIFLVLPEAQ